METWKPIPCMEYYEVSDAGNVRRITGGRGSEWPKPLAKRKDNLGYMRVTLIRAGHKDWWGGFTGGRVSIGVHRLVLAAFVGKCPAWQEVNHKNLDKADNRLENLEYITHKENLSHARKIRGNWSLRGVNHQNYGKHPPETTRIKMALAKRGLKHWRAKAPPVDEVKNLYAHGMSQAAIAAQFGCGKTVIGDVIRGRHWSVGGVRGKWAWKTESA